MKYTLNFLVLFCLYFPQIVFASDTEREKHWSDAIAKNGNEAENQWLDVEGKKVLGLYTEDTSGEPQGGIILLHELGSHPNSPTVIAPLRKTLPGYGWATLSLQLPVLKNDVSIAEYAPLFDEVTPRIKAAIKFLESKNILNIVIVGYDLGATMAADFLANNNETNIKGFVAISMSTYDGIDPRMYAPTSLEKISLPILDIYGGQDFASIKNTANARAKASRKANNSDKQGQQLTSFKQSATAQDVLSRKSGYIAYRQFKINGANHNFSGLEDVLSKRIIGWLKNHAGGVSLSTATKN